MTTQEIDIKALALKLIFDNFSDCDYVLGNMVISGVMVIWTSKMIDLPYHDYNDRPVFLLEARDKITLWDILSKWSSQYWAYFEQIKDENVEKIGQPLFNLKNPYHQTRTNFIRNELLKTFATLDREKVIELMAILIVECARRLKAVSDSSEGVMDDVADVLRFTDIQFQLA
jgi:hypothetical protein